MSDKFYRISIERLFNWIIEEEKQNRYFGLYKDLLFTPKNSHPFRMRRYGQLLETPIGVAAGPQTQMAQNIIASWLTGARYIELKTVQTLDELEVTKPCIDMQDEGYNCEWSQELQIKDSYDEYLNAWIIIHILKHKFGWDESEPGFIFNLSVGYDLEGIQKPNVQWFLDKMNNCSIEKEEKIKQLSRLYPAIKEIDIPDRISNNITLSTMHGCPPDEIESISKYLMQERKLHTTIKLNPTLLGPESLRYILNKQLGYKITVPDEAFEHDLKYYDAVAMINSLQKCAEENNVEFGLKLTNTLESLNTTRWLPEKGKMVYTSGRALHPISINLAKKLQNEFNGTLDISFSAGIDAFNVADTLACNLRPVTVCSDLLKPGGYLRMMQYLENLEKEFINLNANSIDDFITKRAKINNVEKAGLYNLQNYAEKVLKEKRYFKSAFVYENIKTRRELTAYDCIHAPCIEACAVSQNVPEYMYHTANGDFDKAFNVILQDNPLPNITGNVCDHLCQTKCTRMNYDNSLLIRSIKRFNAEIFKGNFNLAVKSKNGIKVSIIGAGPSGLSCAYFLALEGFDVNVYEAKPFAGGMAADSIPFFRITDSQISADVKLIESLGVKFHFNSIVDSGLFNKLRNVSNYIYIGIGAQQGKKLDITGEDLDNVFDQLTFLSKVRRNEKLNIGKTVAIIGGGNSAVDAARTAKRLTGKDGNVKVIYRRTTKEMPADREEINALLEEGIEILELTSPLSISKGNGMLKLSCNKMKLGEPDESGRRRPVPIPDSNFNLFFDSIITAIGQDTVVNFLPDEKLKIINGKQIGIEDVFAGGDAVRGADSLINAIADGKDAAYSIIKKAKKDFNIPEPIQEIKLSYAEFQKKQAYRRYGIDIPIIDTNNRTTFDLVHPNLTEEEAMAEAERCLYCNDVCNICTGVCPNFANVSFEATSMEIPKYVIVNNNGDYSIEENGTLNFKQTTQIFNIGDFCNECGNCNTFCPTNGAPYLTKPKFYLTEESFAKEDNCYLFINNTLSFKHNNRIVNLTLENDYYLFRSDNVEVQLSKKEFSVLNFKVIKDTNGKVDLTKASEMIYLYENLKNNSILKNK